MPDQKQTVPPRPDRSLLRQVLDGINEQNQGDAYVLAGELHALQVELAAASDQKQAGILQVRADEVRDGVDHLWRDEVGFVPTYVPKVKDMHGSVVIGVIDGPSGEGNLFWVDPAAEFIVRRPVPSGANALREALAELRERVEYERLRSHADGDARGVHRSLGLAWVLDQIAAVARNAPAVASSGAEGGEDLIGARDAARLLGVHENTVRNMVDRGDLEPARVLPGSGVRRFSRAEIERMRNEMRTQFAPATTIDELPSSPASAGAEGEREAASAEGLRETRAIIDRACREAIEEHGIGTTSDALAKVLDQVDRLATDGEGWWFHPSTLRLIRTWVEQGRSDAWICHQLDTPAPAVTDPEGVTLTEGQADNAAQALATLYRIKQLGANGVWTAEDCAIAAIATLEGEDAARKFMAKRDAAAPSVAKEGDDVA